MEENVMNRNIFVLFYHLNVDLMWRKQYIIIRWLKQSFASFMIEKNALMLNVFYHNVSEMFKFCYEYGFIMICLNKKVSFWSCLNDEVIKSDLESYYYAKLIMHIPIESYK